MRLILNIQKIAEYSYPINQRVLFESFRSLQ